jgi:hypothetical protein
MILFFKRGAATELHRQGTFNANYIAVHAAIRAKKNGVSNLAAP